MDELDNAPEKEPVDNTPAQGERALETARGAAGKKGACQQRRGFGPRVFEALTAEKNVGVLDNFVMSRARGARR